MVEVLVETLAPLCQKQIQWAENEDIVELNNTISQLDIIDICRLLSSTAENILFKLLWNILGHKIPFNKLLSLLIEKKMSRNYIKYIFRP